MGHTATWKVLEGMMIELRKKGVILPPNVINDLRSAKLMIKISESECSRGEASQKIEEYLGSVESSLVTEAQKTLSPEIVDEWLRRLDEANYEICEEKAEENKFILGVPREQKWIRVEPIGDLTSERIRQIAKESSLSINPQKDGRLVVHGQPENIKEFLKKMTAEATKK
ncbi:MAG: DUF2096 family protein [Candidatus Bathyarchaeia archaeon]|jgi:hypothetical protein